MLEAQGVSKRFGRLLANDAVTFRVEAGEVVALVGENGAGKSTLVKILSGTLTPDAGTLRLDGVRLSLRTPRQAARAGIAAVHQHFALVPTLTALENFRLVLGASRREVRLRARAAREEVGFDVPLDEPVGRLPVPVQQRVEILRALLGDCRYLLLDEPTAALGPADAAALRRLIRDLAGRGRGVAVVTHRLADVEACADRVTVLRRGRNVGDWPVMGTDPGRLAVAMVGELPTPADLGDLPPPSEEVALALRGVSSRGGPGAVGLREVDLSVRVGEILGLAGVSGNGQETLAEVAAGMRRPERGAVILGGAEVTFSSPATRKRLGLGHVPADRRRHGSVGTLAVYRNLCLRRYDDPALSPAGWERRGAWRSFARRCMERFGGAWGLERQAGELSGGNLQRLILAREIEAATSVLVAVYPTRGLDAAAAAQVRETLRDLRRKGGSVLLVSEDLEELLALSDRLAVLSGGRVMGTLSRQEATAERLGRLLAGETGEMPCET